MQHPMQKSIVVLILISLGWFPAQAQLSFTAPGTQVIDFDSDVGWTPTNDPVDGDNVFKYNDGFSTGNTRWLMERDAWDWSGSDSQGLSSDAWSWTASSQDLGMGSGVATQFGDFNNDSDLGDTLNVLSGASYVTQNEIGVGAASNYLLGIGHNGGNMAPWRSYDLVLRVQNNSGDTLSDWTFGLDAWYGDPDNNSAEFSIAWSTDNSSFTTLDSYTTNNNGGTVTEMDLSGSFSTAVADGDYLYLKLSNQRPSGGSGAGLYADNFSVTAAIPEPSSLVLLLGSLGLLLFLRRR